jgi:hypothetical protein
MRTDMAARSLEWKADTYCSVRLLRSGMGKVVNFNIYNIMNLLKLDIPPLRQHAIKNWTDIKEIFVDLGLLII